MPEYQYPLEPFFGKLLSPFERFLKQTTSGGIVLIGTTLLTLIVASSPWGEYYRHIWETPIVIGVGPENLKMTLHDWVNEGLMALFFLLVGLELKREVLAGELATLRSAFLPVAGALGGMLVPALIYFIFNSSGVGSAGWGSPWQRILPLRWASSFFLPGEYPGLSLSSLQPLQLAFAGQPSLFENARTGILLASLISAIIGLLWLYWGGFYGGGNSRSGH